MDLFDEPDLYALIDHTVLRPEEPALAVASANLDHIHHFGPAGRHAGEAMVDTPRLRWVNALDGAPVVARARAVTGRSWPRLAGSDLLPTILARATASGIPIGFLGGMPAMHRALSQRLKLDFPGLDVRGFWCPTRGELDDTYLSQMLADEIASAGVGILVVGLGKPRQENWIQRYGERSGARVFLAFGASADFVAGVVTRAPAWFRDHGLEWAYRLVREPRRLGMRYLGHGPISATRLVLSRPRTVTSFAHGPERAGTDRVTVVIVTYQSRACIDALLDSIPEASRGLDVDVLVVDNASPDGTAAHVRARGDVTVVDAGRNGGYAAGINLGRDHSRPGVPLAILNPDLVLDPGALTALVDTLRDPTVGVSVPLIRGGDGSTYPSLRREPTVLSAYGDAIFGRRLSSRPGALSDTVWSPDSYASEHDVAWASGAAWVVSAECSQTVGEWNESFFLYSEETDYARRVRAAGWRIRFQPAAAATHIGGASGSSPSLAALMELNRIADYQANHGATRARAYSSAVLLRHVVRSTKPTERLVLRTLISSRRAKAVFRGDLAVGADSR